mmetsp:Transcript_18334/g.56239  ORF Transcript_18334/g.56239 Transcript_18334/m.56239 type:complete len:297 (-) Transcript_18334:1148-2038(-)
MSAPAPANESLDAAAALQLVQLTKEAKASDADEDDGERGEAVDTKPQTTSSGEGDTVQPLKVSTAGSSGSSKSRPQRGPAKACSPTVKKRRKPSLVDLHALLHGRHCCYTEQVRMFGARPCLHTRPGDGFSHVDFLLPNGTLDCPLQPPPAPKNVFEQQPPLQQQQQQPPPVFMPVQAPRFVRKRAGPAQQDWMPPAYPGEMPYPMPYGMPPYGAPMMQPPPQMVMYPQYAPPPHFLGPRHFRPQPDDDDDAGGYYGPTARQEPVPQQGVKREEEDEDEDDAGGDGDGGDDRQPEQ